MRVALAALLATTMLASAPAWATDPHDNTANNNQNTAFGGSGGAGGTGVGVGIGVGKGGSAKSSSGAIAGSKSSSSAGASAVGINDNKASNRSSLSTKQLNDQSLANSSKQAQSQSAKTGSQDTSVDASDNSNYDIPVGSVISFAYAPNTIPQAVATDQVVVTSWAVHVLDPVFGMSDQHVHMVPTVAVSLGAQALDTSTPQGTAAAAYICTKDADYAKALAVHCY